MLPPRHTRANSSPQTSLQTAGLCVQWLAGRASWLAHSCLSGVITSVASSADQPGESVPSRALLCLRSVPQPLTNTVLFLRKTLESRELLGSNHQGRQCGQRGSRAAPPPNQRAREENSSKHQPQKWGATASLGSRHRDKVRRPWLLELTSFGPLDKAVIISGPVPFPGNDKCHAQM